MKRFGWKQWVMVAALALAVLLTGFFTARTVRRAIYWRLHRDEAIRPWMSIPYVAHSHRVPPSVLYQAVGVAPQPHDRRPLREIARQQNRSVDQLVATLQDAIAHERASPSTGFRPPSPGRSP